MPSGEQYFFEMGCFKSTRPGAALNFEYPLDGEWIKFWTTGGDEVILTGKEAGELAAFLFNRFPLDTLGNV